MTEQSAMSIIKSQYIAFKINIQNAKGLYLKLVIPDPDGADMHQFLNKTIQETQKVVETLHKEQDTGEPTEYTMSREVLVATAQMKSVIEAVQEALCTHTHIDLTDLPINASELTLETILVNKLMVAVYALLFISVMRIIILSVKEK